jgi:hypothetical protein
MGDGEGATHGSERLHVSVNAVGVYTREHPRTTERERANSTASISEVWRRSLYSCVSRVCTR